MTAFVSLLLASHFVSVSLSTLWVSNTHAACLQTCAHYSFTHTRTHAHAHTRMHSRKHARVRTHNVMRFRRALFVSYGEEGLAVNNDVGVAAVWMLISFSFFFRQIKTSSFNQNVCGVCFVLFLCVFFFFVIFVFFYLLLFLVCACVCVCCCYCCCWFLFSSASITQSSTMWIQDKYLDLLATLIL